MILLFLIPYIGTIIAVIVNIIVAIRLAKMFDKGIGYILGLIFLPFVFYPLLGIKG